MTLQWNRYHLTVLDPNGVKVTGYVWYVNESDDPTQDWFASLDSTNGVATAVLPNSPSFSGNPYTVQIQKD